MSMMLPKNFNDIRINDLPNSIVIPKPIIPWFTIAIQANYSDIYHALKDCAQISDE